MTKILVDRLIQSIIALWGILTIVFVTLHLGPDPVLMLIPPGLASSESIEALRQQMGFNDPLIIQYLRFLKDALLGNFGNSIHQGTPALQLVLERLPKSLYLAFVTIIFAVIIGLAFGTISAIYNRSFIRTPSMILALFGQSVVPFWLGIMLILVFAVKLKWFPPSGFDSYKSIILPAITLSTYPAAEITRLFRSNMLDVLSANYILVAHAKGLRPNHIIFQHAIRNALIPTVTSVGIQFGRLFGASIIVEVIFAWPGVGRLMYLSITTRDFPVVLASTFVLASTVLLTNIIVDFSYTILDPRIRFE